MAKEFLSKTPADLILARADASRRGDYGFIYDSYLADSNFRKQFPERTGYLDFAREMLAEQIELNECRILLARQRGETAEVLYYQQVTAAGKVTETLEVAQLLHTVHGWRFDCSARLERAAVQRPLEMIDWDDFEGAGEKVVF